MLNKFFYINILLIIGLLSGCATALKGPTFKAVESAPENSGIVYMYWTDKSGFSTRQDFDLLVNGSAITTIKKGGYFAYKAKPGPIDLEASVNFSYFNMGALDLALTSNEHLPLNVEAGQTYYIRCLLSGRQGQYKLPMNQVDAERGLREIKTARLLPPIDKN
jgi:Protein of unknown function (DUF2846)